MPTQDRPADRAAPLAWLAAAGVWLVASLAAMLSAPGSWWTTLLVLVPAPLAGVVALWNQAQRGAAVFAAALLAGLAWAYASGTLAAWTDERSARAVYLLEHAGIHASLAVAFGGTLRAGRRPLISILAERVHGTLQPAMHRWTRQVTWAWSIYFAVVTVLSCAAFWLASWAQWSTFAYALTPVCTAAMFVGEYLMRYRLNPQFPRVSLAQMVNAYRQSPPATVPVRGNNGLERG